MSTNQTCQPFTLWFVTAVANPKPSMGRYLTRLCGWAPFFPNKYDYLGGGRSSFQSSTLWDITYAIYSSEGGIFILSNGL
jgi:hypothetical protein